MGGPVWALFSDHEGGQSWTLTLFWNWGLTGRHFFISGGGLVIKNTLYKNIRIQGREHWDCKPKQCTSFRPAYLTWSMTPPDLGPGVLYCGRCFDKPYCCHALKLQHCLKTLTSIRSSTIPLQTLLSSLLGPIIATTGHGKNLNLVFFLRITSLTCVKGP